jgi:hypothetical protein
VAAFTPSVLAGPASFVLHGAAWDPVSRARLNLGRHFGVPWVFRRATAALTINGGYEVSMTSARITYGRARFSPRT